MRHIEDDEQMALIRWARLDNWPVRDYLVAIPNGGYRNAREGGRLKAMGVKPGVSDLFLAYPVLRSHGLWIELKAPKPNKTKTTKEQIDWIERMTKLNYEACICHGWVAAAKAICAYVEPRLSVTAQSMYQSLPSR